MDSPRSQVVALLLPINHLLPLFLLASPCSLVPSSNPFPVGMCPCPERPHSTPAGKADPQHWAHLPTACPHPGEQVNPLAHASSTSPPGPSPGQSLSLDPGTWELPPGWSWPSGALPLACASPSSQLPRSALFGKANSSVPQTFTKAELPSQHWRKE